MSGVKRGNPHTIWEKVSHRCHLTRKESGGDEMNLMDRPLEGRSESLFKAGKSSYRKYTRCRVSKRREMVRRRIACSGAESEI